ncbi:MAG: tRNA (adenosine(37)-N6)-dimethylallyltransferase MiaA [Dehalococcoidia bacterium]
MIAIVGPTAVGKSELALHLARYFAVEVISADSRQVYRYMDIGTNKPSLAEGAAVPHHMIDVVEPDEEFSLAMYQRLAGEALQDIRSKGKMALLVGGSGLYVWSLMEGWQIPQAPPDRKLRSRLEARAEREGTGLLFQELQDVDPVAASRIGPSNIRRIIRALEIYHKTGRQPSQLQRKGGAGFPVMLIGLTQARDELYRRIDGRVDEMISRGLIEEVRKLLERGYDTSLPSMTGIGYKQIAQFLGGEMTLPKAVDRIKHETHRLARHQYAWFRLNDSRIHWYDVGEAGGGAGNAVVNKVKGLIEDFITPGSGAEKLPLCEGGWWQGSPGLGQED